MYKNKIKRLSCILCGIIFSFSLVGCDKNKDKEKVEYVNTSISSYKDAEVQQTTQVVDEKEIWEDCADEGNSIYVEADVVVPDTVGYKVISAREKFFTPDDRKEVLNALSGNVYKYDENNLPKSKVAELIQYDEKQIEKYSSYKGDEEWLSIYQSSLEKHQKMYETAPESLVKADTYEEYKYYVEYEDLEYLFGFYGSYGSETLYHDNMYMGLRGSNIIMELDDIYDLFENPDEYREKYTEISIDVTSSNYNVDNKCSISLQDAQSKASEFVRKFDFGNFKVSSSYPLRITGMVDPSTYDIESWYDGYVFIFNRNIDGVNVDGNYYNSCDYAQTQIMEGNGYAFCPGYGFEDIIVCVNDKGIVYMQYRGPLEMGETVADEVVLMDYESIKNIMLEKLPVNTSPYVTYTHMELCYFPIKGENQGDVVIIPVWRLTDGIPDGNERETIYHYMVINAMDGTEVNVGEIVFDGMN